MSVTEKDIADVVENLIQRSDKGLLELSGEGIADEWYFIWDDEQGIEWNTYMFSDELEAYKRRCRKWEEHHNGPTCVVERVRIRYLMPKINGFLVELAKHFNEQTEPS